VNPLALVSTVPPPILALLQITRSSRIEALSPRFMHPQFDMAASGRPAASV
jgi:hypothetical protein